MKFIIFEDSKWINFLPFSYTRAVFDLRVGILKLRQRLALLFNFEPDSVLVRQELVNLYIERHPDWMINDFDNQECIFINGRLKVSDNKIFNQKIKEQILNLKINEALVNNNEVIAFKFQTDTNAINTEDLDTIISKLSKIESDFPLWTYVWEFINDNGLMIKYDYEEIFYEEDNNISIDPGVTAINPYDIWIGEGTKLGQGAILDASAGPIVIDENVEIMYNTVVIGPAYIGKNSIVKIGSKIYQNTSIGPYCKIGGEIEDSIIQAFSNKQHDGFIGHSFIGEWVNIGADTNNSDLKNTYKPVKVWFYPEKKKVSTESMFIGTFIGDHSKIGINCSVNTGAVIGFGVNIYGRELISDFIPSFSWGEANNLIEYHFEKFLETAKNVKIRRRENLVSEEIKLIEMIYKNKNKYEGKNV
ncbi:MAG: putative sugar nucleotidyl transferase [Candidatus Cloacimonetes bacterium]|jgi:UDP-N-acetylglucosamine diphosphorylase/glucosamine-1-phosphate N-acetyltransferase|nr:hypothetical protein [Candidatus Cloacimonadota bacterium]MDD4155259.1 putative sugar nucleotidyl transferase [Candidatus Cloacimonadota bacterium]